MPVRIEETILKIALVYNSIPDHMLRENPLDRTAEYDSAETIETLRDAMAFHGHDVLPVEADAEAYQRLRSSAVDLVFNIAEGQRGEDREAQIPAMLEMLGIPYTGSGPLTLALCLHKARAKEILSWYHIPTPAFQVMSQPHEPLADRLRFPLIVKLLHEGSSMGLSYDSVVETPQALANRVDYLTATYEQPVLVEQFIDGREFTVAVLGNDPPQALPVIEVLFTGPRKVTLFQPDDPVIDRLAQVHGTRLRTPVTYRFSATRDHVLLPTVGGDELAIPVALTQSVCPANLAPSLEASLHDTALRAFQALDCRDWGRIDMRLGADGMAQVLELNPIAGLDPACWFPRSAQAAGMDLPALLQAIIQAACRRYGL